MFDPSETNSPLVSKDFISFPATNLVQATIIWEIFILDSLQVYSSCSDSFEI